LLRSFICFNDSCFHARLLVETQQQKRWRSEQRQRFLCCTRTWRLLHLHPILQQTHEVHGSDFASSSVH
jgi:hypothetical protein